MPSRAERRQPWERAARGLGLVLLLGALVLAWRAVGRGDTRRVHVAVDGGLSPVMRDSLAALAAAGDSVSWSGSVAAVIASAEAVREPSGATRFNVVADSATALGDSLGLIDSLSAGAGTLTTEGVRGQFAANSSGTTASVAARTAPALGRVLVIGRVGWESKFTIAALEEAGWLVDARLRLSDTITVEQGRSTAPNVGAHAAVVVLDSLLGAETANSIARFVRAGGGLVLSGDAVRPRALAALTAARVTGVESGEPGAFQEGEPLHALPFHALGALTSDAVVLETRDDVSAVVARRVAAGRVIQSGYAETWRWRMQGEAGSVEAHRAHWSRLVGTAAPAEAFVARTQAAASRESAVTSPAVIPSATADPAPLASLVDALGPAQADAPASAPARDPLPPWLGAIALLLLVAEWASRRARGAS
ncbi:MAG: hypothetical protein IT357_07150 [Gemmatimonadaceae bacterium]|nr:hypothetical protein [Gemmatimonadaceae bacterium]